MHSTIYPENQPATRYTIGATIQNTKCQDSRTAFSYKSSSESTDAAVGTVNNVQYNMYDVIWPCRAKVMHNKHTGVKTSHESTAANTQHRDMHTTQIDYYIYITRIIKYRGRSPFHQYHQLRERQTEIERDGEIHTCGTTHS